MKLVLASESFVRKQAMDMLAVPYEVIPSHFDEQSEMETDPHRRTLILAEAKAKAVGKTVPDAVVIGSDTLMERDGRLFEKPVDLDEASEMLQTLSGNEFEFITGLAVYRHQDQSMQSAVDTCRIKFRELSLAEIEAYISSHPVLKCAGGFDVEGALCFAESASGAPLITTAMSLCRLVQFLQFYGLFR